MTSNIESSTSSFGQMMIIDGTLIDDSQDEILAQDTSHSTVDLSKKRRLGDSSAVVQQPSAVVQQTSSSFPRTSTWDTDSLTRLVERAPELLKTLPDDYEKKQRLFRKLRISVSVYKKHLANGTLPKDIDFIKHDSNPYSKLNPNRDALREQETTILKSALKQMVELRLSEAQKAVEYHVHAVDISCTTELLFPGLEELPPTYPLYQQVQTFLTELKTNLQIVSDKMEQWNRTCDEKYYLKNPSERPAAQSTTSSNSGIESNSITLTRENLKSVMLELLQELKPDIASKVQRPSHKATSNNKNSNIGRKKQQKNDKKRSVNSINNQQQHTIPAVTTSTSQRTNVKDNTPYKTAVMKDKDDSKIQSLLSQAVSLLQKQSSQHKVSHSPNNKPPNNSGKKKSFHFACDLRGNDQRRSNR